MDVSELEKKLLYHGVPEGVSRRICADVAGPITSNNVVLNPDELYPIYVTNDDGDFIWLNKAMADLFDCTKEELMAINVSSLYVNPEKRIELLEQIRKTGRVNEYEVELKTRTGNRQCKINTSIIASEKGPLYQGTIRDITYKRMANEQKRINDVLLAAQTVNQRDMHDVNNALGGVKGNAQLLKQELTRLGLYTGRVASFNDAILEGTERAVIGVESIRGILSSNEVSKDLDINKIVETLISMVTPNPRLNGYSIKTNLKANLPIHAIKSDLYRVIENLIINAAESKSKGGEIIVSSANSRLTHDYYHGIKIPSGSYVKLSVQDFGCGMDEDVLKKALHERVSTKRSNGGFGLYNVNAIVNSYGGYITVTTALGEGTTFDIYLPAIVDRGIEDIEVTPTFNELGYNIVGYNPEDKRILIVEDEESIRDLLGSYLTSVGYNVEVASSAYEGAEMFLEGLISVGSYDLVLTDVNMPGLTINGQENNGAEGLDLARFVIDKSNVSVVLMSGYRTQEMQNKVCGGIKDIIFKPFNIADLELAIVRVLGDSSL
ncbi:response regulator [Candidatus Woesearchaeota archaeon]|jgi:PAS domain S-box-containing protein|nr:response regulator [Candidatus Woesearchaeota archaeon]